MSQFTIAVSQNDDDSVIRRDGEILCRLPASELSALHDAILESLCGPNQAALSGVKAGPDCRPACGCYTDWMGRTCPKDMFVGAPENSDICLRCGHKSACHS